MINTKIYINSELIDLTDEVVIPLTYSIADVREPEKRNTTFSKTVTIPGTQFNNDLFGHLWNVNVSINSSGTTNFNPSFNPNLKASAIITYKDVVQFTGIVQLLNVAVLDNYEVEYEVAFFGELANIFQALENKTLSELDLSEYDHTYTKQAQINSWDYGIVKNGSHYPFTLGEGYVYPMIDYGYNNNTDWNVKHFFPAVYAKTILDKIFSDAGFVYESNFFASDLFKRLVIPYSGGSSLKLTDTQIENRTFRAASSGTTSIPAYPLVANSFNHTITVNDETTSPNFDTGNTYNKDTSTWTCQKTGTYNLYFNVRVNITYYPSGATANLTSAGVSAGNFGISKNGTPPGISAKIYVGTNNNYQGCLNIRDSVTVTSGTTSPTYEGQLAVTIAANAGDTFKIVYIANNVDDIYSIYGLAPTSNNYYTINFISGSVYRATIADPNIQEGDNVEINAILPDKFKQSEFLSSIIKMFNLFVQQDKLIPNKLYIEPRVDFYDLTDKVDWTQKLDESKDVKIIPMGDLDTKSYLFSYKSDEDYYNKDYFNNYAEVYGRYKYDIENDFLKGEIKNEVIFSPTLLADSLSHDRIISRIYDVDEQGTIKPRPSNLRILYYGGVKDTNQSWNYLASSGTTTMSTYAYAGHVDEPTLPTIDLSFGVPREVYWITDYYTANNLVNIYWKQYLDEISDKDSKILVAYFHLTELDINQLDFKRSYYFKNEFWRLNKIEDYNPGTNETVKCEFIKLKEVAGYAQDTGVPIKGGVATLGNDIAPASTNRTLSTNSYGIKSYGEYNTLPEYGSGILVTGDYNTVGQGSKNVTILGSSGVTVLGGAENITLINSDGVTVTESNTSYINGVKVSTNVPKVYKALLTQSGTNAPTATVLVNTLSGTPTFLYTLTGTYQMELTGEFLASKTFMIGNGRDMILERANDNRLNILSFDSDLTTPADDILANRTIYVEVYN